MVFLRCAIDPPGWEPQRGAFQDLIAVQLKILMRPRAVAISVGGSDSFLWGEYFTCLPGCLITPNFFFLGLQGPFPFRHGLLAAPLPAGNGAYPGHLLTRLVTFFGNIYKL